MRDDVIVDLTPAQQKLLDQVLSEKPQDTLMTTSEIAEIMRVHTETVRQWIKAGKFGDWVELGVSDERPVYRVWRSAFNAFLASKTRSI